MPIHDVSDAERNENRIKCFRRERQAQRIPVYQTDGLTGGLVTLFFPGQKHGMGKIQANDPGVAFEMPAQGQGHITGAAGHIQYPASRTRGCGRYHLIPPHHILAEAEQPVQKIIPVGDFVKHALDKIQFFVHR